MEIDPDEVKRHLDILGYTSVEPNLLDKFVEDLKKLIEYDQKHGDISMISTSLNQDWDNSYSKRIKTSTTNKNIIDNSQIASMNSQESNHLKKKKKCKDSTLRTSSKIINYHNTLNQNNSNSEYMQQKCYFCGQMESKPKIKIKHKSNLLLPTIYIGATFNIE